MQTLIARAHMALTPNAKSGQKGVTAIEYGLIAAVIAVLVVAAFETLGGNLQTAVESVGNTLTGTASNSAPVSE